MASAAIRGLVLLVLTAKMRSAVAILSGPKTGDEAEFLRDNESHTWSLRRGNFTLQC